MKQTILSLLLLILCPIFSSQNTNTLNLGNISNIRGTDPRGMEQFIQQFPFEDYDIVTINNSGSIHSFFCDHIPDYIKNTLRSGRPWEPHLTSLISKYVRPGSLVLDIGAHIGTHTVHMSKCVGPNGQVIAFEPQPKTYRELVINMALNECKNISFFWAAASDEIGSIELGPLNIRNEGGVRVGKNLGTNNFVESITIDSLNLSNISLIKIDVEGFEENVLNGARNTIRRNKPVILIEICGGSLPEKSPKVKSVVERRVKMIEDMGYTVRRWNNWWDYIAIPK